jgi:HAD superfamily hydrolase (TIGR01509 family)
MGNLLLASSAIAGRTNPGIEAVIFDLDGVLADSEPLWTDIDAAMLAEYGVSYAGEHKQRVIGTSFPLALGFYKDTFKLRQSIEELISRRQAIAAEYYATRIEIFSDAPAVLHSLRAMKMRIGLATSSLSRLALSFLERHRIGPFFDAVVAGEEVEHGKPAPDIYWRAAHKLGVAPERCLVVEDSLAGVTAGQGAGMTVAAIPDPRFVRVEDYTERADYVLSRLSEVTALAAHLGVTQRAGTIDT